VLEGRPFVGFLLITDPARAKAFYCEVLGLPLRQEDDVAVVVWRPSPDSGGVAWFRDPDGNRLSLSHRSWAE
jgi:predicted enzyme related to lactoylglutathione lyase